MTIIKLGGAYLEDNAAIEQLSTCLGTLKDDIVLVHGGGTYIDDLADKLEIPRHKTDGIRITTNELMHVVDMVLNGRVNTWLVRKLCRYGYPAIGMSLSSLHMALTRPKTKDSKDHTGYINHIDTRLITYLLAGDMLPVVAPTAMNINGEGINVNADDAATSLAVALGAQHLLFISDVPGVLENEIVQARLTLEECTALIDKKVIHAGMLAKIMAARSALERGIQHVVISNIEEGDDLKRILQGEKGTSIYIA